MAKARNRGHCLPPKPPYPSGDDRERGRGENLVDHTAAGVRDGGQLVVDVALSKQRLLLSENQLTGKRNILHLFLKSSSRVSFV